MFPAETPTGQGSVGINFVHELEEIDHKTLLPVSGVRWHPLRVHQQMILFSKNCH